MKTARALRLIRRLKAAETEVSDWEGEFLDSVESRLGVYGRAFADPEKGGRDSAVSVRQQRKLKEIQAKLDGDAGPAPLSLRRTPFRRKAGAAPAPTKPNRDEDA